MAWAECPPINSLMNPTQMLFFNADTQQAFTTLVAGLTRVFSMHRPGMVNLPVLFTSFVATSAKVSSIFLHTAGFCSVAVANAAAIPDLDMAAPAFMAAFMAVFMARGAILMLLLCNLGAGSLWPT